MGRGKRGLLGIGYAGILLRKSLFGVYATLLPSLLRKRGWWREGGVAFWDIPAKKV